MGYAATATPGDMNCTYEGPGKAGAGQFRIIAVVGSSAEAQASAKRMRDHQHGGSHDARLGVVESQGNVVFSIALFQHEATDATAARRLEAKTRGDARVAVESIEHLERYIELLFSEKPKRRRKLS